jgi:fructokinase
MSAAPTPFAPARPPVARLGVDFGGTKIEAAVLDSHGNIVTRLRRPNPGQYEAALRTVHELVNAVCGPLDLEGTPVGVGIPGSRSPKTGLIRNANTQYLNGKPFQEDLTAVLGRPVRLANDANCFALSEAIDGAGAGASSVFGAILGTGCGAGLVVDGRLVEGANAIAGEWGHLPLPWSSLEEHGEPACWCGRRGCLENWVSGPAIARWASLVLGSPVDAPEVAARAAAGDQEARACLDLLEDRLARGLGMIVNLLDPAVIVLGGGVSNIAGLADGIARRLPAFAFSDTLSTQVVVNRWGDSSGVRGAAWLWGGPP